MLDEIRLVDKLSMVIVIIIKKKKSSTVVILRQCLVEYNN